MIIQAVLVGTQRLIERKLKWKQGNVKHKGNITVILVVGLVLLIRWGSAMGAQANKHDTNQEYTDLDASWNKEKNREWDFYRIIVENNLFHPLGWQTPNREPK